MPLAAMVPGRVPTVVSKRPSADGVPITPVGVVLQDPEARLGLVQALIQQAALMVGEAAVARQAVREALEALLLPPQAADLPGGQGPGGDAVFDPVGLALQAVVDALGQGRSGGQQPETDEGGQWPDMVSHGILPEFQGFDP